MWANTVCVTAAAVTVTVPADVGGAAEVPEPVTGILAAAGAGEAAGGGAGAAGAGTAGTAGAGEAGTAGGAGETNGAAGAARAAAFPSS